MLKSEHSQECIEKNKALWGQDTLITCWGKYNTCGHSFECYYTDEARNHNHRIMENVYKICGIITAILYVVWLCFH